LASPRRLLAERGLAPRKGLGQNFLADANVARNIVRKAGVGPTDYVLEIGPGLGALTVPLLETGARVTVVEKDEGLAAYLREECLPLWPDRLTIIEGDALEVDWGLAAPDGRTYQVVGNLPYLISTPILLNLVARKDRIQGAVLMFQTELAERLAAGPGSKDYGRLSVLLGYYAEAKKVLTLGPEAFHPRPKVGSTVLDIRFKNTLWPELNPKARLEAVVAAAFARRRKTLRNSLGSAYTPDRIQLALADSGLDGGRRAETLSVEEFIRLANAFA
jgi:16S rRNA (adenine1518-N6/adenine1519-N6)-dimethyltransferase